MNLRQTSKTTSIDNALEMIRNNFFYVMFLIVKDNRTSKIFVILSNLFIFCQYCYLNFGLKIKYIWQDPIVETINLLLKYFTITINVKNIGFINYLYVFYASLTLVIIAITLMLLLIFVFKTKRFQKIPILLLRQILKLMLTFGYWPIVRMQFGLLACQQNKKGQYVMMFETKQECWVGNYTFHAIIAIFGLSITIIYTLTIQYFAYQKRLNKYNALAMQNSQSQVTLLIYIFIQIMVYQLTPTPKYTFLIIFVYLLGSGFYFKMTHIEQPFCHEAIQKFISILASINLWVIVMMTYAYFMEGKYFNHNLLILLLTIPLIVGLILQSNFYQFKTILHDLSSYQNGKTIVNLCNYLLYLLEKSDNNQRSSLLLQGFIEVHREVCQKSDCYAKKATCYTMDTNQKQYIITHLINQIFVDGLQNYPEDIDLRLNYIFFLIDHRNQYSQALSEIFIAEQFSQSNNQKFQLYLNKKIIQQYLADAKNTIKFDKFADAAFQKQDKEFYTLIEAVTHLFIDFWSQLQEEIINISILLQIGYNLIKQKKEIQQQYIIIMSQSRKATKIKRFYEDFLQIVANEHLTSELKLKQEVKYDVFQKEQLEEIQIQPNPIAIISAHTHQEPQFLSVNKSFCRFIGYTKTDLINMPLNNIIPQSFSLKHTQCIENFLIHKVTQASSQLIKSKLVFVKQKNKYITQCWVDVKLMEAHHNELLLVAQFQPQFQIKNSCYIIISKAGVMLDMTSNCIPLLGLEVESILLNQINIQELFPDFFMMRNEFKKKGGSILIYQNQLAQLKKSIRSKSSISSLKISSKFICHISDIEFPCLKEENVEKTGILIKLDLVNQKTFKKQEHFYCSTLKSIKPKKIGYFRFAQKHLKYQMDEIFVDEIEDLNDQILLNDNLSRVIGIAGCLKMSRRLKTQILKIQNYGEGIRICRLMNNQVVDVNDIDQENQEEDGEKEIKSKKEQLEFEIEQALQKNGLSKLQEDSYLITQLKEVKIQEYLQNPPIPFKLKIHIQMINIFFIIFTVLQILSFVLSFQNENLIIDHIGTISVVNERMSSIFMIQSILQDIRFINLKYYDEKNITKAFDFQLQLLNNETQYLKQIHNYLSQIQIEPSSQYQEVASPYNLRNIQMIDYQGNSQYYSFKETVDQLISKALLLRNEEIQNFSFEKPDFYYYLYNSLNTVIWNGRLAEIYYQCVIFTILDQTNDLNNLFFILNTILISSLCLIIIYFLIQIYMDVGQIINLVVDFEENQLIKLKYNCESFLNILFFDECEEIRSQDQDDKLLLVDNNVAEKQKKRKINTKHSIISLKKLIIKIGIISICLEFYFTFMYLDTKTVINEYYELIPILNKTSIVEGYYRLQDNFVRELFINPNISILNSENNTATIYDFFDILYNLNADLFEINNEHKQFLQSSYQKTFDQIQLFNPCNLISVNKTQCESFQNGILKLGQSVANMKYIEDLRILFYEYEYGFLAEELKGDIEQSDQTLAQKGIFLTSLLNSDRAKDVRKMQQVYIRKQQQFLVKALESSIVDSFNQLMTRKSILLSFSILIFVFIFILWIPLSKEQLQQLNQTKQILTLFPFEMLMKSCQAIIYFKNLQIW